MSTTIKTQNEYLNAFSGPPNDLAIRAEALKQALDIRKFEIELYWKRTTYFWALIAASFAGYFALQAATPPKDPSSIFLVCCIGSVLSIAWYLVNRGSKFWQENWERHVDTLEDQIMGPLYKTTKSKEEYCFLKLWDGYPYSVSKINQVISLFISFVWLGMTIISFPRYQLIPCTIQFGYYILAALTVVTIAILFWLCRTGSQNKSRSINFTKSDLVDS